MARTFKDSPRWLLPTYSPYRTDIACVVLWRECGADRADRCAHDLRPTVQVSVGWSYQPSTAERHLGYWAPERQAVRRGLVEAVKRARAGQTFDDDPVPTGQHRHAPSTGGWWD